MMLYMRHFTNQSHDFYGVIYVHKDASIHDAYEEKFYRSIATMIMLQLDHIHLMDKTQEVSHAKSTFISHMSHELRTPLHMILSSTQYLIGYENLTHEQQRTVVTMESSANHLLGMINDILDLVQIEAGKVAVIKVKQSSDEVIIFLEDIIAMLEVLAEQKGVSITLENTLEQTLQTSIDIKLFKQIIINLLSNAIKFTDKGSISFSIKASQEMLLIEIKDTGLGISPNNL
jgi:signal transduction histidine kinase